MWTLTRLLQFNRLHHLFRLDISDCKPSKVAMSTNYFHRIAVARMSSNSSTARVDDLSLQ